MFQDPILKFRNNVDTIFMLGLILSFVYSYFFTDYVPVRYLNLNRIYYCCNVLDEGQPREICGAAPFGLYCGSVSDVVGH